MPYKTLEEARAAEFPTSADDIELTLAQVNKLAELYDAIKAQGNADNAMAVAWTAWKRLYEKKDGKWVEREKAAQMARFFVNAELLNKSHDTILQTLDRWILRTNPRTGKPGRVCYSQKAFTDTVAAWNGVPIIFAQEHPDMDLFATNPAEALKKIKGRIVGESSDSRIEKVGHPRLMTKLNIRDNEINTLTEDGKLSVSSGFYGDIEGDGEDGRVTSVIPQHILLFQESEIHQPVDQGSQILNSTTMVEEVDTEGQPISQANADELDGIIQKLQAFLKRILPKKSTPEEQAQEKKKEAPKEGDEVGSMVNEKDMESVKADLAVANSKIAELAAEMDKAKSANAELTKGIADRDEAIKNMTEKLKAYEDAKAAAIKATQDKQFEDMVQNHIPKGLTADDEKKAALRKEYDEDPRAFALKVLSMRREEGTPREGQSFANAGTGTADRSVGGYNALKREFEPIKGGK